MIKGARAGWFGLDVCCEDPEGEAAGDEYEDMIVVIKEGQSLLGMRTQNRILNQE